MIKIIIMDKDGTVPLQEFTSAHLVAKRNSDDIMREFKIVKNRWGRRNVEYHKADFLLMLEKEVLK